MANMVIKKRVSLEFLGEEHKEDYLIYSSIPIKEFQKIAKEVDNIKDDNIKSLNYMQVVLKEKLLGGKFGGEDVTKENVEDFDIDIVVKSFEAISGQLDPKVSES